MTNWRAGLTRNQREFLEEAIGRLAETEMACRAAFGQIDKADPLLGTRLIGCAVSASNMRTELRTYFADEEPCGCDCSPCSDGHHALPGCCAAGA